VEAISDHLESQTALRVNLTGDFVKRAGLTIAISIAFAVPFWWTGGRPQATRQTETSRQADAGGSTQRVEEGIPITSDLVKRKCASCHKADEQSRLPRISYRRATPEGWQETIRRMVALNGLQLDQVEGRDILRYLADNLGLAPAEAKAAAFEVEHRTIEYRYTADKDTEDTCTKCHSIGRVMSQRRTKEEWGLLVAMHRAYYPYVDFQAFRQSAAQRRAGAAPADGRPPDNRQPMEKAIAHLSTAFPLKTAEWAAWSATMRPPRLEGKWALSGYQANNGAVFGQVVITGQGDPAGGAFTTESTLTYPRSGQKTTRRGRAIVYTGFQWRGTSHAETALAPGVDTDLREVMFVDQEWQQAAGRWFTGAYGELGIDVRLRRIGTDPILLGAGQPMMTIGGGPQDVHLYGANLPSKVPPGDLSFGAGITVDRITTPGRRVVLLSGATSDAAVALYDKVDFIKVRPEAGLSRLGGIQFPKQFQQFEALAYLNGPDGRAATKDDVELGLVDALWAIEEYPSSFDDDDKDYVGNINSETGLFTPNVDGPNGKRKHNANNYGDVWVAATYLRRPQPGESSSSPPLKARAHLLVTVPLYIRFDQPEVGR
jgi:quinohemoprotein amine dehydrogenase